MSSEEQEFEGWEEVIKDFIYQREKQKIVDLLSKKDGELPNNHEKQSAILQLHFALENLNDVDSDTIAQIMNRKNVGKRKIDNYIFQQQKHDELLKVTNHPSVTAVNALYNQKKHDIQEFHKPFNWISYYSKKSGGVKFATHVAKIMHSSIKDAPSFYVQYKNDKHRYIATSNIKKPVIDDAIDNAALTPIANFLKIEHDGVSLGNLVNEGNNSIFSSIAEQKISKEWVNNFSLVFSQKEPRTHSLQKQIFFPINHSCQYHLLCIVKSSSLAHYFFEKAKNQKVDFLKYSKKLEKRLVNIAALNLTASSKAHTNVSPLHAKRSGRIHLFSTQPPTWESQLKPPIYKKSLFDNLSNVQINEDINYLREFLLRFKHLDLSIKDPKRNTHLVRWVESIIDEVFFYANSIQKLPAPWSVDKNIKLSQEHQYFLDPYRDDEEFQTRYIATDWQTVICDDFAAWLNRNLAGKDKKFTPQAEHTRLWKQLFKPALREDTESIKAEKQYQQKEVTA